MWLYQKDLRFNAESGFRIFFLATSIKLVNYILQENPDKIEIIFRALIVLIQSRSDDGVSKRPSIDCCINLLILNKTNISVVLWIILFRFFNTALFST